MKKYYSVEEIEKTAFEYLRTVINDSSHNIEIVGKTAVEIFSFIDYIEDREEED